MGARMCGTNRAVQRADAGSGAAQGPMIGAAIVTADDSFCMNLLLLLLLLLLILQLLMLLLLLLLLLQQLKLLLLLLA